MRCDALFGVGVQGKSVCISGGLWARREYEAGTVLSSGWRAGGVCYLVTPGETVYLTEIGVSVSASLISDKKYARERAQKQKNCEYFDYNSLSGQIYIRSRKNGDTFVPFGIEGSKKLKDFLLMKKFPRACGENTACGLRRGGFMGLRLSAEQSAPYYGGYGNNTKDRILGGAVNGNA